MKIVKHTTFESVDKGKFTELVRAGFRKDLVPDYFEYVEPDYICLALSDEGAYIGAIVVERIPELHDVCYLDKIVVDPEMQGKGVGKSLWSALNGNSSKLIWRAKKDNPINGFYEKQSEGRLSFPGLTDYVLYYYGLYPPQLQKAIDYALSKKPTLVEGR